MSDPGIFFLCFRDREPAFFKRHVFVEIFSRGAFVPTSRFSDIEYADGYTNVFIKEDDEISSLSFNRSWGDTFIKNLLELADRTGSCIVDSDRNIVITDPGFLDHIPHELLDWDVHVVRSPEEFIKAIGWRAPKPEDVAAHLANSAADRAHGSDHPGRYWPFVKK
jgi:hypothetical protein